MATFAVRYEPRWEEDLKREGLYGPNFDTFWRPVEESFEETPDMGYPLLDGSGARGVVTEETALDLPRLVVYFKVDFEAKRVVILGMDRASTEDDYPPPSLRA